MAAGRDGERSSKEQMNGFFPCSKPPPPLHVTKPTWDPCNKGANPQERKKKALMAVDFLEEDESEEAFNFH